MTSATVAEPTTPATRELATIPHAGHSVSTWLTPQSFEAAEKIATLMAKCGTLPKHLVGQPADCFRIVVQAAKWGMDPFAVGEHTSLVHGRMCYEGKLVHAVLIAMGAISEPLDFAYDGEGERLSITVSGKLRKSGIVKSITGTLAMWRSTSEHWKKDPHSALAYRGTRQFARLYAPDAMLGVVTPDEVEDIKTVEAQLVPETTLAKAREVEAEKPAAATAPVAQPAASTKTPAPSAQPLFTVNDLVNKANEIHNRYKAEGLTAIKKFMDRIGVLRVNACAPEKVGEAMEVLKAYERELEETGKVAP